MIVTIKFYIALTYKVIGKYGLTSVEVFKANQRRSYIHLTHADVLQ